MCVLRKGEIWRGDKVIRAGGGLSMGAPITELGICNSLLVYCVDFGITEYA